MWENCGSSFPQNWPTLPIFALLPTETFPLRLIKHTSFLSWNFLVILHSQAPAEIVIVSSRVLYILVHVWNSANPAWVITHITSKSPLEEQLILVPTVSYVLTEERAISGVVGPGWFQISHHQLIETDWFREIFMSTWILILRYTIRSDYVW